MAAKLVKVVEVLRMFMARPTQVFEARTTQGVRSLRCGADDVPIAGCVPRPALI